MAHVRLEIDRCIPRATSEYYLEQQSTSLGQQSRELAEIRKLHGLSVDHLSNMANDLADQIAKGTGAAIVDQLKPVLEQIVEVVSDQVANASKRSEDAMTDIASQLSEGFAGVLNESMDAIGNHATSIATSYGSLATGFEASLGSALDRIEEGVEQTMTSLGAGIGDATTRLAGSLSGTVDAVAQRFEGVTESMTESFRAFSAEASASLKEAIGPLIVALRALHQITGSLEQQATEQSRLLRQYDSVGAGLTEAARQIAPVVGEMRNASTKLDATSTAIGNLLVELGEALITLQATNKHNNDSLAVSTAALAKASHHLNEVSGGLNGWVEATSTSLERFGQTMSDSVASTMTTYDSHLAQAVEALGSYSHGVQELVEDLADRAKHKPPPVRPS